jgi:hypothetical protein
VTPVFLNVKNLRLGISFTLGVFAPDSTFEFCMRLNIK